MKPFWRFLTKAGMVAGAAISCWSFGAYYCVDNGVFEKEPAGIAELREERDNREYEWLPNQVAWLTVEGTHIDYPVMQTRDNEWYLTHDYYEHEATNGAIFLDYRNSAEFSDSLSIIYGHRMNGDLMFADVAKYNDSDYLLRHQNGRLTLRNKSFQLQAVEHRSISAEAVLYRELSDATYDFPVLVLSTCSREVRDSRDILIMRLIE